VPPTPGTQETGHNHEHTPGNTPQTTEEQDDQDEYDAMAEWCEGEWGDEQRNMDVAAIMDQVRRLVGYEALVMRQKTILRQLVKDTVEQGSIAWGTNQARIWGVDRFGRRWTFDTTRLVSDTEFIALHGNLPDAARARWHELFHNRMTEERVRQHLDERNPYFHTVAAMAQPGGSTKQ
jgi:hypothetical protein